jgi:polygalacturonase
VNHDVPVERGPRHPRADQVPTFPATDFDATRFGAKGEGRRDDEDTDAFRRAIQACNRAGGGRVLVPAGTFLTGAIHLLSNVNLHVSDGATIKFSTDPKDYLPLVLTWWEETLCYDHSSSFAHIADSRFNTNDDCVVLKSGRDADGRRVGIPTADVLVERCTFSGRWGGITVGSETSGGVSNVFARDCEINPPDFPGRYRIKHALYVRTNSDRGGVIDGIHLRDFTGHDVEREVLFVSMFYNGGGTEAFHPQVNNVTVDRLVIDGGRVAATFEGLPQSHIRTVRITNSRFTGITAPTSSGTPTIWCSAIR